MSVFALYLLAALATALMAGFFWSFSVVVMDGLRLLPPQHGMRAMQAINAAVRNPAFGLGFFGTPILCALGPGLARLARRAQPRRPDRGLGRRRLTCRWSTPLTRRAFPGVMRAIQSASCGWRRRAIGRLRSNQCKAEGVPKMSRLMPVVVAFGFGALVALPAFAQSLQEEEPFFARLGGLEEVPSVSTDASGSFIADLIGGVLDYRLRYDGIATPVLFAHIHLGQARTNGGVAVFLCDNTGGAPAGTPSCPQRGGEVIDSVSTEDVVGPEGQGIRPTANISQRTGAGEFEELIAALREGATYVNVHSEAFPGGEIRGQIR